MWLTASLLEDVEGVAPPWVDDEAPSPRPVVGPVTLPVLVDWVEETVPFSWKIPPANVVGPAVFVVEDLCELLELLLLEDDEDDEDEEDEEEEDVVNEEVVDVVDDLDEDVEEDDVDEESVDGADDELPVLLLPSRLKTTMLALPPLGMVATQKSAPPAPDAASALVTLKSATLEAPISQGRPLQPLPLHSMRRPKVGFVFARLDET